MTMIPVPTMPWPGERPEEPDAAKALVVAELYRLVERGGAVMTTPVTGTLELRLATGQVFQLGEKTITRIA